MASGLHFIVLLCLTSGLWIGADAECGHQTDDCNDACPSGWTGFCDRCYQFQAAEKDWADAEKACTLLGGNLASIPNEKVYRFLRELVFEAAKSHQETWVGGYGAVKEGVWLWSDGNRFDFNLWHQGEPNNVGGEDCMEINFKGGDYINDHRSLPVELLQPGGNTSSHLTHQTGLYLSSCCSLEETPALTSHTKQVSPRRP